ncbi:MAG: putative sulfate exporter family transporter [Planctomycetota bacterium]
MKVAPAEDILAILIGGSLLLVSLLCVQIQDAPDRFDEDSVLARHGLTNWVAKPGKWANDPGEALGGWESGLPKLKAVAGAGGLLWLVFAIAAIATGQSLLRFSLGFAGLFVLATAAYLMAGQVFVRAYNLEYALWALVLGLVIANTVGTPRWIQPAANTEFYIKTGLVLLGSEILMSRLLALGPPGIAVAWVVTPIVLVSTFWFGQRVLKMESPTLNMVISADMSVCGVSAAIASAAACRAKKEELSLAIGLSLSFTVIMMVVMPAVISATGMTQTLGGAWMGGTIDASGAVAAAGEMLGDEAAQVAVTIKMIQNILIGVAALGIAVFWTTFMDRNPPNMSDNDAEPPTNVGLSEVWFRFPKFILGFLAASILFSWLHANGATGALMAESSIGVTKILRGWLFCLAFVSIGLETDFRKLRQNLQGGKPLVLYIAGQSLNLVLTLAMAYVAFEVLFPQSIRLAAP